MNTYTKKYVWMLLLIFCFLFFSESVNSKGAAVEKKEEHRIEEYENAVIDVKNGRYLTIYVNETSSIQIDLILIIECLALLLLIVLEKVR